jgi:hypothetical protein
VSGILVVDHHNAANVTIDPESDPVPDKVAILDNFMMNNGYDTIDELRALMLTELKTGNPDIVRAGEARDACIRNRHRYMVVGVGDFADCDFDNTDSIDTYLLPEPVAPRAIDQSEQGRITYLGICTGCHTYTGRMIGPPGAGDPGAVHGRSGGTRRLYRRTDQEARRLPRDAAAELPVRRSAPGRGRVHAERGELMRPGYPFEPVARP